MICWPYVKDPDTTWDTNIAHTFSHYAATQLTTVSRNFQEKIFFANDRLNIYGYKDWKYNHLQICRLIFSSSRFCLFCQLKKIDYNLNTWSQKVIPPYGISIQYDMSISRRNTCRSIILFSHILIRQKCFGLLTYNIYHQN